jgi:hypothetical protein
LQRERRKEKRRRRNGVFGRNSFEFLKSSWFESSGGDDWLRSYF